MWLYEQKQVADINDIPEGTQGFIYKITNLKTGKFYIGKKSLVSNQKKKMTQKELAAWSKPGKKPTHKRVIKESDWLKYWGSNKPLQADVKELGEENFSREIIRFCKSKKQLTYWEVHYQFKYECLTQPDKSYNDNILGKFFVRDLLEA